MHTKIFVNLPVKDLYKSIDFFKQLGFDFDPQFTDENATCMIIGEDNFAMLVDEKFFKTFTKKEISDAAKSTEVIVALAADSREKVDEIADKALTSGGKFANEPMNEGFMYSRSFQDPDSHLWEIFYMDPSTINQNAVQ